MVSRRRSISMSYAPKGSEDDARLNESIFELKEVHNSIRYDWPQLLSEEANPIEVSVALLDDTSVGMAHRIPEFESIKENTETALRHVVNEHHELFNNSIGSYHLLLSTLAESQQDSLTIKEMLESTTKDIHDRSDILSELSQTSTRYADMIEILDAMAEMTLIPDKIDQLVVDKKIHEVYDVIAKGYKTAEQYNLWSLPAMNAIQSYLEMQSNNLFDMIIDELQSEIYLKGTSAAATATAASASSAGSATEDTTNQFFTWQTLLNSSNPQLSSLKTLITESHNLEQYIYNSANLDIAEVAEVFTRPVTKFINEQLPVLHSHFSSKKGELDYSILLESTSNFSAESFHYTYMLLHTASKLSRLHQVVEILSGNNQSELHGMISKSTEEVKQKHSIALGKLAKLQNFDHSNNSDIIGNNNFSDTSVMILQDLFGSVFVKSLAVLQRHKIVSEIVDKIESGQSIPGVNTASSPAIGPDNGSISTGKSYDLNGIWLTIKKELQSLMSNYIYEHSLTNPLSLDVGGSIGGQSSKIHDVLRRRNLFRFEDVEYDKTAKTPEDIQIVLQDMFPGFGLSDSFKAKKDPGESSSPYIKNETFNAVVEILVPKNLFNMRIILEFFLIFIAGSQNLFADPSAPSTASNQPPPLQRAPTQTLQRAQSQRFVAQRAPVNKTAINFFEDFMRLSFLTHVKESLDSSFREYIGGSYARNEKSSNGVPFTGLKLDLISLDRSENNSLEKGITSNSSNFTVIYQNALDFKRLFFNICSVLNTSLTYRQEFSTVVLNFLEKFSDAYTNFYTELLSTGETRVADYNAPTGTTSKPVSRISKWMRIPALTDMSGLILQEKSKEIDLKASANNENGHAAAKELSALLEKELQIFLYDGEDSTFDINKDDLLDNESFNQVCYLLLTTSWILTWLPLIKKESNYNLNQEQGGYSVSVVDKLRYDWSFLENGRSVINVTTGNSDISRQNIYLALSKEKIQVYDSIIQKFQIIRDRTLLALRYDLRCKAIYYIGKSFRQVDWMPTTEPGDTDHFVGLLNKEVFSIDNKLTKYLSDAERESIFVGLPEFLDKLVIQGSVLVRKINANGVKRVLLNIFTLQQLLRNLVKNPEGVDFTRSSVYFDLFTMNEFNFINYIKSDKYGFTRVEFKNLARMVYSEKLADGNGSQFNKTKYTDLLKKIDTLLP